MAERENRKIESQYLWDKFPMGWLFLFIKMGDGKMKRIVLVVAVCMLGFVNISFADTFGTGTNAFDIDFVTISGDTNPDCGYGIVNNDYRMGTCEITNGQFAKFASNSPYWTGADVSANMVTWYEAAQFVNYLNTSTNNPAAYNFSGSTFSVWDVTDAGFNSSNPFRNSNAKYFMPTENEWVKAAYWNGTNLQTYATTDDSLPVAGIDTHYKQAVGQPWNVGSGSEELNGTFDMMGNVWEWMENSHRSGDYLSGSFRSGRGGSYSVGDGYISSSTRLGFNPYNGFGNVGFRVASVPEPASLVLLFDIKPSSCPNPVNVKSNGVFDVAILGTEEFDVLDIDITTITLEGVAPIQSRYKDETAPVVVECPCFLYQLL